MSRLFIFHRVYNTVMKLFYYRTGEQKQLFKTA